MKLDRRTVVIWAAVVIGLLSLSIGAEVSGMTGPLATNGSTPNVLNEQGYSGTWMSSPSYNESTLLSFAETSTILSLPAVSSWLAENNISLSEIGMFFGTLVPSTGNPFDYTNAGGSYGNGTTFLGYAYLIKGAPDGLAFGVDVAQDTAHTVLQIYTWQSCGPNTISSAGPGFSTACPAGTPSSTTTST